MSTDLADILVPLQCRETIGADGLVAVNSNGGKDSQAMTILLSCIVPWEQRLVVHAPLGEVESPDTIEHIEATLPGGVPLILAPVASGKTLLDRVEERGKFPGIPKRWCTAEHKRGPIERELRRHLKAHPCFGGRLVNCLGIRRDESAARAKRVPWRRNERMSPARPRGLRLAADLRPPDPRRVLHHPRRRPVAAQDLPSPVAVQLLVLHFLVAPRLTDGGRTPCGSLPPLCADRAPYATPCRRRAGPCRS